MSSSDAEVDAAGGFVAYAVGAGATAVVLAVVLWPAVERVLGDSGLVRFVQAGVLVAAAHCSGVVAEAAVGAVTRARR